MKIDCNIEVQVHANNLGQQVAALSASDAQDFWFGFVDKLGKDASVKDYAMALAPYFGGKRKEIFMALYHAIQYHSYKEEK